MQRDMDNLVSEILNRLAAGEEVITRILTMRWFSYEVDGDAVVITPEIQQQIEDAAGEQLVEWRRAAYPGELALGFRPAVLPQVRARLAAAAGRN